jgi:hypothetical protein
MAEQLDPSERGELPCVTARRVLFSDYFSRFPHSTVARHAARVCHILGEFGVGSKARISSIIQRSL